MFVIINDNEIKVKSVITPEGISKGMMGRRFDDNFNGLLFFISTDDMSKGGMMGGGYFK